MHDSVFNWVHDIVGKYGLNNPEYDVLELGSLDVNGTVRNLFDQVHEYIGVDMREGPGVDVVANANDVSSKFMTYAERHPGGRREYRKFDVIISTEMLEHDAKFWLTIDEVVKLLKKDSYFILTARGNGFREHEYPHDYWRFMPQSFPHLFDLADCLPLEVISDWQADHQGMFGIGRKRG